MKNFIEEFKAFAIRGNVIDLAVAVVIGTAFGQITTSLVNNIIMPLLGVLIGGVNFKERVVTVGDAEVAYGVFVQSIIEFVIIAFAIFVLVKGINTLKKRLEGETVVAEVEKPTPEEILLLRDIRELLMKRGG